MESGDRVLVTGGSGFVGSAVLAALADARSLDLVLSRHSVAAPESDLVRRILASAPSAPPRQEPAWKRPHWWLSGAGLVGVAGIAAGVLAISLTGSFYNTSANPPSLFDQTGESTVFSSATADWSDQ